MTLTPEPQPEHVSRVTAISVDSYTYSSDSDIG